MLRKPYRSDVTDAQWERLKRLLPKPARTGRPRERAMMRILATLLRGERVDHFETERITKDGGIVHVSLSVSPIVDAGGAIVGGAKIARDITARKRNEAERAEFHRRLSTLVAASSSLLDSPETDSVLSATLKIARQLLVADGESLINDGFPLLPTLDAPHWTVVLATPTVFQFERVRSHFRGPLDNPTYRSGRS